MTTEAVEVREILPWGGVGTATRELAQRIADDGFEPEVVIAIARGGVCGGEGRARCDAQFGWQSSRPPPTWRLPRCYPRPKARSSEAARRRGQAPGRSSRAGVGT